MAVTSKTQLKNWFLTTLKPLQAHYHAWMDSYWHKDELIPGDKVDIEIPDFPDPGLIEVLINLVQPVVIEATGPVTVTMQEDRLLTHIVVISSDEQTVNIGLTENGQELVEAEEISPHHTFTTAIYNTAEAPLYFSGFTEPLTIKLYYR